MIGARTMVVLPWVHPTAASAVLEADDLSWTNLWAAGTMPVEGSEVEYVETQLWIELVREPVTVAAPPTHPDEPPVRTGMIRVVTQAVQDERRRRREQREAGHP